MKTLLLAIALSASATAFADTKFDGLNLELGGANTKYSAQPDAASRDFDKVSGNGTLVDFGVKYTFKVSPKVYVGVSYERTIGDSKLGSLVDGGRNTETDYTITNADAFVIAPGYALNERTLVSLRVGYVRSDFDITDSESTNSFDQSGYSLGLGVQHFVTDNVYVGGSVDASSYSDTSGTVNQTTDFTTSSDATKMRLHIGYNF